MSLQLIINGKNVTGFKRLQINQEKRSMGSDFTLIVPLHNNNTIKFGDAVKILVNGITVFNGFVEQFQTVQTQNNAEMISDLAIVGREWNYFFEDNKMSPTIQFTSPTTITAMIMQINAAFGYPQLAVSSVVANVAVSDPVVATDIDCTPFEFISQYCNRLGCMLDNDSATGGIQIWANNMNQYNNSLVIINDVSNPKSSKLRKVELKFDPTKRYGTYVVIDQYNQTTLTKATAQDSLMPASKQYTRLSDLASSQSQLQTLANWYCNTQRSLSLSYEIELSFTDNLAVQTGDLIRVNDVGNGLNGYMLVNTLSYIFSVKDGNYVSMGLTYPDAYSTDANMTSNLLEFSYVN